MTLLAFALGAGAEEHYVDAVGGDDANSGASPSEAWRTIHYAVQAVALGDTIHVLPGVYSAASGESFPILIDFRLTLVADGGPDVTILDGGAAVSALITFSSWQYIGHDTVVQGFTLRGAGAGVRIKPVLSNLGPTLRELRIRDMSFAGVDQWGGDIGIDEAFFPLLQHVDIRDCRVGIVCEVGSIAGFPFSTRLEDSLIADCQEQAVHAHGGSSGGYSFIMRRTRILGNGAGLDFLNAQDILELELESCLVAGNGGAGIAVGPVEDSSILLGSSTVADNAGAGFATAHAARLRSCILWGNQDDLFAPAGGVGGSHCDIGDGDVIGLGCFSADPLFLDPLASDYRLSFGSPCLDSGAVLLEPAPVDLVGTPRPLDGDLDTEVWPDVGAFELAPLVVAAPPQVGGTLRLELWGPPSGMARVHAARGPLTPVPRSTPYGDFYLNPAGHFVLTLAPTAPGPPALLVLSVPDNPALAGTTWSFQALSSSGLRVPPAAYTNPVEVVFAP